MQSLIYIIVCVLISFLRRTETGKLSFLNEPVSSMPDSNTCS